MALPQLSPTAPIVVDNAANFVLQIDSAAGTTLGTGSWVTVFGIESLVPNKTDNLQDITNFDTRGWMAQQMFLSGWSLALGFLRGKYAGSYDVGQELIRAQNEAKTQLHVRWFDINGSVGGLRGLRLRHLGGPVGRPERSAEGELHDLRQRCPDADLEPGGDELRAGRVLGDAVGCGGGCAGADRRVAVHRRHRGDRRRRHRHGQGHRVRQPDRDRHARRLGRSGGDRRHELDRFVELAAVHARLI
jgi:hypothetical protein